MSAQASHRVPASGPGRLPEPQDILDQLSDLLA